MIELFKRYFDLCPLVAIIRGVTPEEVEAVGKRQPGQYRAAS